MIDAAAEERGWLRILEFAEVLAAYSGMDRRDEWRGARELLERLADTFTQEADESEVEHLDESLLPEEAVHLLSTLEGSLVLCESADDGRRAMKLEHPEIVLRAHHVGEGGTFGEHWRPELERGIAAVVGRGELPDAWSEDVASRRRTAWPFARLRRGPDRGHASRLRRGAAREATARVTTLVSVVEESMVEAVTTYRDLDPDGRQLTAPERATINHGLESLAHADRSVDLEREAFPQTDWALLRLLLAECRTVRRNMTLAGSRDARRRGKAMSIENMQARLVRTNERLDAAAAAVPGGSSTVAPAKQWVVGS